MVRGSFIPASFTVSWPRAKHSLLICEGNYTHKFLIAVTVWSWVEREKGNRGRVTEGLPNTMLTFVFF